MKTITYEMFVPKGTKVACKDSSSYGHIRAGKVYFLDEDKLASTNKLPVRYGPDLNDVFPYSNVNNFYIVEEASTLFPIY